MSEPDLPFFQSISWCVPLIEDPSFIITPTLARQYKDDKEDSLWAVTLKTAETFSACLSQYKPPPKDTPYISELRMLISLGSGGLEGHPDTCHGGIVTTIIDDTMGFLLVLNRDMKGGVIEGRKTSTAYLNMTFLKPVATPQVVLSAAKLTRIQGRKYFIEAALTDAEGEVLVRGDALWIGHRNDAELKGKL